MLQTGRNNAGATSFGIVSGSTAGRESAIEAALGGARLLTKSREIDAMSSQQWPVLLSVDEGDFVRRRSEPGRLTSDLDLVFERATLRGSRPLADGSTQDIGPLQSRRTCRPGNDPCRRHQAHGDDRWISDGAVTSRWSRFRYALDERRSRVERM